MNHGYVDTAFLQDCGLFLDVIRVGNAIVVDGCCEDAGTSSTALRSDPRISLELGCVGVDVFQ